jgi:2-dehydro-3-deoxyphosphogluconate aldolase/(4S)-4-hydroxy-2-oxoglutarate aldolase
MSMTRETIRAGIADIGIIPAVRLSSAEDARFAAEVIYLCGIHIVEVTMTVPGAVAVISQLARQNSALIVGGGHGPGHRNSSAMSRRRSGISNHARP